MSAILYCHIQLFIDDLRWHRARGRGRYWRLKLRMRVKFRAKCTERKDNYIFGRTSSYILLCVYSSRSHCVHLVIFRYLIFWFQITMTLLDGRMVATFWMGKDLVKQSSTTWSSNLDYSGGIEMGHYENQPRYSLSQLPLHLPARWYNCTSVLTNEGRFARLAESNAVILNYFNVTNSGLENAKIKSLLNSTLNIFKWIMYLLHFFSVMLNKRFTAKRR
jgi:hypothetical protein